ncbi:MAG: hypothetical protein ACODAU_09975 [Myxococcota bacterium]
MAEEPAVPRHVEELVEEVLHVVDEVRRGERRDRDASGEASEARALDEALPGETFEVEAPSYGDRGMVPFTRTVVSLLWRGLPVGHRAQERADPRNPILIQVKPKGAGGQFRCTVRF